MLYIAIAASIIALVTAGMMSNKILREKVENKRMQEISDYICVGTMTYLVRQYKVLSVFVIIMFGILLVIPGLGIKVAVCYIIGSLFSVLAGFFGMRTAIKANVRTAQAALKGQKEALNIAFSGGAVMGLLVVGFGLMGLTILYMLFKDPTILIGFAFGASSIALFCRVGGGIFTKAADIGADLVGKIEEGMPEDDQRNPAVIADNVGDNVGDVAGMGSDLFESYVGSGISAMMLGLLTHGENGILYPLLLMAFGIIASLIGIAIIKKVKSDKAHKTLESGTFVSAFIILLASLTMSLVIFGEINTFIAVASGIAAGIVIGKITEYYTSCDYDPVKSIAENSKTGSATNILSGLAIGMKSTVVPVFVIAAVLLISFASSGLFGIALAAVGMLSTVGIIVSIDAYGPIADNAGGIAQMAGMPESVRKITDKLDAVGNTTAAIGKGFSIGSAALTALAFFSTYSKLVDIESINVMKPVVIAGVLVGGMLPYLFSALTIEAVSNAANSMINEVRRQFREIAGIMDGSAIPEYAKCVDISTKAALKGMVLPTLIAITAPIIIGVLMGREALGGLLVGATITGIILAIQMSNSGGAWDNAKKHIENGSHGGHGSDSHKAAVVGDTVGDPFKDTAGPSINILIKLIGIIALIIMPIIFGS